MTPLKLLGQDDKNEVKHVSSGYVMPMVSTLVTCAANDIINDTAAFLRSEQLK